MIPCLFLLICLLSLPASAANPELATQFWPAYWISVPGAPPSAYGVYHFRRAFELSFKPGSFLIHVSADNRYQLFVNGERAAWGPARGDLFHWRYETVDIAPLLRPGRNVLAAVVWNSGEHAPQAQVTNETGFLLQGDTERERIVDTNSEWKCVRNEAYEPIPFTSDQMRGYYVAGPGDRVTGSAYPWGWERPGFDDSGWRQARLGTRAAPRYSRDSPSRWMLVPRSIPMMEESPEKPLTVRQTSAGTGWQYPAKVPAQTKIRILFDQTYLTTAYPELTVSGGRNTRLRMSYAEALWIPGKREKGNRNEVAGKEFIGNYDEFIADGGSHRLFRPLWWRTYRYLELEIETAGDPIVVEKLSGTYTGYPFERKARLESDSGEIGTLLDVGWRTARLCAHESYMDCPYYEQLQYAGDTRIQALVSLYMSGDARLMRNAIEQLDSSRTSEGATFSRAPSRLQQYIPPFSLWWVGMVHDYWRYQDDPAFVKEMLPGVRAVLSFFEARQKRNGSLGVLPWWNFVDWTKEWRNGVPPAAADGSSAPLDLQLLLAYDWASGMEQALGMQPLGAEYRRRAEKLRTSAGSLYWDSRRRLYADTPGKTEFSQHTNALAVIAGLVKPGEAARFVKRIAADSSLVQASIYFRHYLHSAFNQAGAGDDYLDQLDQWRTMLQRGLTTWAEQADPTRSDCHAWGSSPNYEVFRTVLGIDSAAPGFRRVIVRPFSGKLLRASGAIPHPRGEIAVRYERKQDRLEAEVRLPAGVEGEFVWRGESRPLKPGANTVALQVPLVQ
ncbi:MAG: alpha-L-rhamnosidase N-terminal domain-containing protein [Bryobacteraceae bacterium]|nr:alpha-L-rhamnosidase N-terminal domain-containing protein [Bryobacterales bacterium]MEB2362820.1 alpha-L-rhamnosidase N-terminal domain-containing protein [Bryobacterales bacterium]NUN01547.1 alpha-L-rhamnosidase N-terminal domain-containing protein [Bryobacteraceae bacterium]